MLLALILIVSQRASYDPMANAHASGDKDRIAAAVSLTRGSKGLEPLIQMAHSKNSSRRGQAVWALAFRREQRAIRVVVTALFDSSPFVQEKATWSIRRARDPAYRLLSSFATRGTAEQRRRSQNVMLSHSSIGNLHTRQLLKQMLSKMASSHFEDVRQAAARYMNVGDYGQPNLTMRLLADQSTQVRKTVVTATYMSGLQVDPIFTALARLVKDKEPTIRAYAVATLARYPNLRGSSSHCWEIMQITSNALRDPSPSVRCYVLRALDTNISPMGEQAAKALLEQYPDRRSQIESVSRYLRGNELRRRIAGLLDEEKCGESARALLHALEGLTK